jgi:hypothetical protein
MTTDSGGGWPFTGLPQENRKGKTLMEAFAAEEQQERQMDENGERLLKTIRWQNILRLSEELKTALKEVKSSLWVQRIGILCDRAEAEIECANVDRAVE